MKNYPTFTLLLYYFFIILERIMMTEINKVAIYVRVSTSIQAEEGYSIDEQIDKLKAYCQIKDWTVYEIYKDGGFSGGNIERPALERLIKDANNKKFDTVLVYKLDRLSRSQKDTLYLIEDIFSKNDISFLSLQENFDTSTAFGKAMIGLLSVFAQLEREQIKERMQLGRVGRAKSGKPMMYSSPSFGYNYSTNTQELTINQAEAIIVKRIFDEYISGMSLLRLMEFLNDNNLLRNGKKWNYQGLIRILRNPVYIGKIRYNNIIYPGLHEPIIDDDTFYRAQKELDARQNTLNKTGKNRQFKAKYMLSGTGKCGYCGAPLTIRTGKKRKDGTRLMSYQCWNRYPKKNSITVYNDNKKCNSKHYNKEVLEDYVIKEVRKLQLNPKNIDKLFAEVPKVDTTRIKKQINSIDSKINRLNELYLNDMIDIDRLKSDAQELKNQKKLLESELDKDLRFQEQLQHKIDFKKTIGTQDITTLDYEQQSFIVKSLVDKIIVKKGVIDILWKI